MGLLLLVRHGQASFGADDYDVLSEIGWEQGRRLGGWLAERGLTPDVVVRGSMRRHRETLDAMTEAAGWTTEPVVDDRWDEFDHLAVVRAQGESVDGLDRRGFQQLFERATSRWTAGVGDYPETYAGFVGRVDAALDAAAAEAGSGRTVVAVSSGGPIGVACARLVDPEADPGGTARLWARFNAVTVNSSVTRVVVGSTGARLLTFNEHPHLDGDAITYR
ncbi:histidine phosphatase family protein [Nocardioides mangrovi]|uniref:Histidine phosphatase family protein n=1 Tax=Nocardioides mangrovi TaxID=2874580 RepID=A0ABS7UBE9_9ACTN|nr:histidine phosphatase family protein [Nocardioides mangrovi]MBZ5738051.1 histidine phosphatase family protein [Nocardioides mangrovi]